MRTIASLFGRSPFAPLQAHMENVADCIAKTVEIFAALQKNDYMAVEKLAKSISKLEHIADLTKNEIRNNLQRSLFLPMDRGHLLEVLGYQDAIADQAEDLAALLTYTELPIADPIKEDFDLFLAKNFDTFHCVRRIIQEIDELLAFSFGGSEAEKVRTMIDEVGRHEHEADLIQRRLVKNLFANEESFSKGEFYLWMRLVDGIAGISNLSEKLANRIRMTLELSK